MNTNEPEWRKFELFVSRLESLLDEKDCKIKSPDMIIDRDTGELREVDASLRFIHEGNELVISIECRRRKEKQDVTWIEQLSCKKDSLGLAGTIAVSSKGFSKSAVIKAAKKGILLRKFEEITDPSILDEFRATTSIKSTKYSYRLDTIGFFNQEEGTITSEILDEVRKRISEKEGNAEIFKDHLKGVTVQLKQLIQLTVRQRNPNEVGTHRYACRYRFNTNQCELVCSINKIFLKSILVGIEWTVEEIEFDTLNLARYSNGNELLMEVAHGKKEDKSNGVLNLEMYFKSE